MLFHGYDKKNPILYQTAAVITAPCRVQRGNALQPEGCILPGASILCDVLSAALIKNQYTHLRRPALALCCGLCNLIISIITVLEAIRLTFTGLGSVGWGVGRYASLTINYHLLWGGLLCQRAVQSTSINNINRPLPHQSISQYSSIAPVLMAASLALSGSINDPGSSTQQGVGKPSWVVVYVPWGLAAYISLGCLNLSPACLSCCCCVFFLSFFFFLASVTTPLAPFFCSPLRYCMVSAKLCLSKFSNCLKLCQ